MGRGKSLKSLELIEAAVEILEEIQPASVRAVCYRLFTLGLIENMSKNETNKVSTQLTWAREHGEIDWDWIVDETREAKVVSAWKDPAAYVKTVKRSYRRNRWTDQPARIEVWSEKATISGTLAPVLETYGLTFRVMHGYGSSTALHQAALDSLAHETPLTVFYLGDWDPSGLHMSEFDLPNRLEDYGGNVELIRLALSDDDITSGTLPWFPVGTKGKDARYDWYISHQRREYLPYDRCWELDALSPNILRARVEGEILERIDAEAWERAGVTEQAEIDSLNTILSSWPGISGQASK